MQDKSRDIFIIQKILKYCDDINDTHALFKNSYETFQNSSVYKNSVAFCLLQIGELSNKLTDEFKEKNNGIPWRAIKGMRNIVAHEYGHVDEEVLWNTAHASVERLRNFCKSILS